MAEEGETPPEEPPAWMREYGDEDSEAALKIQGAARGRQSRVVIRALRAEEAKRPQNTGWAYDTLKNVYVCNATTVPKFHMMGAETTFPSEEQVAPTVFQVDEYTGEKDEQGRFSGKGKAKLVNGSTYDGMWEGGLMHGIGTLKFESGVSFKGPFVQGRMRGKGMLKWPGGNVYDGEVVDGHRHGKGKFVMVMDSDEVEDDSAVVTYDGMWANGRRNGYGVLMYDSDGKQKYEGEWLDDQRHGKGTMYYRSGNVYRGGWRRGNHHGYGQMMWYTRNEVYVGEWVDGFQHGQGEHVWFVEVQSGSPFQTQNRYKGMWEKGLRHGSGLFEYADGSVYKGEWANNVKDGQGVFTYSDGRVVSGTFSKDRMVSGRKFRDTSAAAEVVLAVDDLLSEAEDPAGELASIKNTLLQYMSELKQIFRYYSQPPRDDAPSKMAQMMQAPLGPGGRQPTPGQMSLIRLTGTQQQAVIDNAFAMSMIDFWKFAKECRIPDTRLSLAEIDRVFMAAERTGSDAEANATHVHNPSKKLIFRQFIEGVVRLAHFKYSDLLPVSRRLCHALYHNILPYACQDMADDVKVVMESSEFKSMMLTFEGGLRQHFTALASKGDTKGDTMLLRSLLDLCAKRGYLDQRLTYSQVVNLYYRSVTDDVVYQDANTMNIDVELIYEEFLEVLLRIGEVRSRNASMEGSGVITNKGFAELAASFLAQFLESGVQEGLPKPPPATVPAQLPGRSHGTGRHHKSTSINAP